MPDKKTKIDKSSSDYLWQEWLPDERWYIFSERRKLLPWQFKKKRKIGVRASPPNQIWTAYFFLIHKFYGVGRRLIKTDTKCSPSNFGGEPNTSKGRCLRT